MASFVVIAALSERLKQAYLKAIRDASAGSSFVLPEDIEESREHHSKYMSQLKAEGKLFCAGPFDDFNSALFIFDGLSREEIEQIMAEDSHVKNGYISDWEVREWHHRF